MGKAQVVKFIDGKSMKPVSEIMAVFMSKGMLKKDIATTLQCSPAYLSLIINGKRRVPGDFVDKVKGSLPFLTSEEMRHIAEKAEEARMLFDRNATASIYHERNQIISLITMLCLWIEQQAGESVIAQLIQDITERIKSLPASFRAEGMQSLFETAGIAA